MPYALLRAPGWGLGEAVDPADGEPGLPAMDPPVAWWAEHHRRTVIPSPVDGGPAGTTVTAATVVSFGHRASPDDVRVAYEPMGFTFEAATVDGRAGLVATGAANDPAVVVIPFADHVVVLLSYQLSPEELVALAADVEPVDAAGWVEAGGEIR